MQPSLRFMIADPLRLIALGFGSGLSRWAPGTVGTLWAWGVWELLLPALSGFALYALIAVGFLVGIPACGRTAAALGVADHGSIVWDEVIAFWLLLACVPAAFAWQLAAFLLFRLFDIVKPPPIRQADRAIHGGFGIMFDDLLAALVAAVLLFGWKLA